MPSIAVLMATYMRSDGKSPFYLKRALDSVFSQKYQSFKVFVIGDKYESESEFLNLVKDYPKEKIYYENLPYAKERDKYVNPQFLWSTGGVNAINHALDKALSEGFDYMAHLDHDDWWTPEHLQVINEVVEETNADWVCTKSTYMKEFLPRIVTDKKYVEFPPTFAGVINSSTCINFKTIPIRYRNVFEEDKIVVPADADRWLRCAKYITENNLRSYFANVLTCFHDEETFINKRGL